MSLKSLPIYQVDAFATKLFQGNPAAVCPLEEWLPDALMQSIAQENNLSETAFFVPQGERFEIRWFTPNDEVALCGHATLASAHVLFEELGYNKPTIALHSPHSGPLEVFKKRGCCFWISLPIPLCPIPWLRHLRLRWGYGQQHSLRGKPIISPS